MSDADVPTPSSHDTDVERIRAAAVREHLLRALIRVTAVALVLGTAKVAIVLVDSKPFISALIRNHISMMEVWTRMLTPWLIAGGLAVAVVGILEYRDHRMEIAKYLDQVAGKPK